MRTAGLVCKTKRKFKATTHSAHNLPVADNLLDRQFTVQQPNQAYVGDIAYIHTQEGWLSLAVVIDLYSRQVMGWSMAEHANITGERCVVNGDLETYPPRKACCGTATVAVNTRRLVIVKY